MNYLLLFAGIIVVILATLDLFYTTVSTVGSGRISWWVTTAIHKTVYLLSGKSGKSRLMALTALFMVFGVLLMWVLLLWVGYSLIFMAESVALYNTVSKAPATTKECIYYAGYSLSTMGNGNIMPRSFVSQILTDVASLSGIMLITVAITFLSPMLTANIHKRRLSAFISSIGESPIAILLNTWNGKDFSKFNHVLPQLITDVNRNSQSHFIYPMLHYFHSNEPRNTGTIPISALYEATLIIQNCIPENLQPERLQLNMLRSALEGYASKASDNLRNDLTPPPLPDIEALINAGVPARMDEHAMKGIKEQAKHRAAFEELLRQDGWQWNEHMQGMIANK